MGACGNWGVAEQDWSVSDDCGCGQDGCCVKECGCGQRHGQRGVGEQCGSGQWWGQKWGSRGQQVAGGGARDGDEECDEEGEELHGSNLEQDTHWISRHAQ